MRSAPDLVRGQRGFTIVEAFIVLVILAFCVALATIGFHQWLTRTRTREVTEMLGRIRSQEQAFRSGGGQFLSLRADAAPAAALDESAAAFYPLPADSPSLASARRPTRVDDPERWPPGWREIGLRPPGDSLYCTYFANAGDGSVPAGLRYGADLLAGAAPGPWFYALAVCNLEGEPGYPGDVTVFGISSHSDQVRTYNEGR